MTLVVTEPWAWSLLVAAIAIGALGGSVLVFVLEWFAGIIADRVDRRDARLVGAQRDGRNAAAGNADRR